MDYSSDNHQEIGKLIKEFRDGTPSAGDWKIWREVLEVKRARLIKMLEEGTGDSLNLKTTIVQLDEYIIALQEEEIISTFTEDEIRFVLEESKLDIGLGEHQE